MTSPASSKILSPALRRAFSLVEVVLAMAIVAFSLLAIVGTLPMGLQTMRDSQNDQAIGTIANQIRGDLQQIAFTPDPNNASALTLPSLATSTYYYTTEGLKTTQTGLGAGASGPPFYQASFTVTDAGINGSAYAGTMTTPSNAATITVTLKYPVPILAQSTSFNLLATKQIGL